MFGFQGTQPFLVEIIRPPTPQTSVADVLIGSLGLVGALALVAVPLGLLFGWLLVSWRRRHRPDADRMPPVSPLIPGSTTPPTSRVQ